MKIETATRSGILLLIASDPSRFDNHVEKLEMFGEFQVKQVATWQKASHHMEKNEPDVVLIDYRIFESGGEAICEYFRRYDPSIPIVVFADKYAKAELVLCLNAGANDYVTSADDPVVIAARVRAHRRARLRDDRMRIRIGSFWFIPDQKALLTDKGKVAIPLTDREVNLISYLARHPNKTVKTAQIQQDLWGYHARATTHTIQTHVYRLRQKFEPDPSAPTVLVSDGSGYSLVVGASNNADINLEL